MLKYVETLVTFSEVPDEISLCISISGCDIQCPDCHSKYLWADKGENLTLSSLIQLIKQNTGISCVCFLGGDANSIEELIRYYQAAEDYEPTLEKEPKWAWYTGKTEVPETLLDILDYVKTGPFVKDKGPLTSKTTNQRMLKKVNGEWVDITYRFWKDSI